jgi:hypothetical protein
LAADHETKVLASFALACLAPLASIACLHAFACLQTFDCLPHCKAANKSSPGPAVLDDASWAPPSELFGKILEDRIKGLPYSATSSASALSSTKSKKIAWCLHEALRQQSTSALLSSDVIAIHQDVRQGVLMVRFSCCSCKELKVTKGILGIARNFGTTAVDILEATMGIVRSAFHASQGPASSPPAKQSDCNSASGALQSLTDDFWAKVELFDADGAQDEQLVGKILGGASRDPSGKHVQAVACNLRVQLRDRTHASTRVLKLPWLCDQYWSETFTWFTDLARLIRNSSDLSSRFKVAVSRQRAQPFKSGRLVDLSFAKQRMSSTQRPLSRGVLFMDALISVCNEIVQTRTAEPKKRAQAFIDSCTAERLITLGLLADTGDECAAVTRYFDTPDYDLCSVPDIVKGFQGRLDQLFVKCKVLTLSGTYTSMMLTYLRASRLLKTSAGPALLGGSAIPAATIARCKSRMNAWANLALRQLEVELRVLMISSA